MSVVRTIQEPGQFLVVFPKTFTSYVCSGYSLSESVYYAPRDYLSIAEEEFAAIRESGEPMMFPLPKLLLCIAKDDRSPRRTLRAVRPFLERMRDREYVRRSVENHSRDGNKPRLACWSVSLQDGFLLKF